jgi:uncharacterized protein with von Willebrand factor type A (vWA) domain
MPSTVRAGAVFPGNPSELHSMAAKKPAAVSRKLIEFDAATWQALDLLARDSMTTWQELADEAFRDLLKKHGRPTDLRAALRQSMRLTGAKNDNKKKR